MAILSPEMIKNLHAHRYLSEGHSIMEFPGACKYIAEKLPRRLSPNAVSLFGLLSSYTTCILAAYHSCIGNEEVNFTSKDNLELFLSIVDDSNY